LHRKSHIQNWTQEASRSSEKEEEEEEERNRERDSMRGQKIRKKHRYNKGTIPVQSFIKASMESFILL
jgi:hypothetical protein